jgi:hypothetical protein
MTYPSALQTSDPVFDFVVVGGRTAAPGGAGIRDGFSLILLRGTLK